MSIDRVIVIGHRGLDNDAARFFVVSFLWVVCVSVLLCVFGLQAVQGKGCQPMDEERCVGVCQLIMSLEKV